MMSHAAGQSTRPAMPKRTPPAIASSTTPLTRIFTNNGRAGLTDGMAASYPRTVEKVLQLDDCRWCLITKESNDGADNSETILASDRRYLRGCGYLELDRDPEFTSLNLPFAARTNLRLSLALGTWCGGGKGSDKQTGPLPAPVSRFRLGASRTRRSQKLVNAPLQGGRLSSPFLWGHHRIVKGASLVLLCRFAQPSDALSPRAGCQLCIHWGK